jgi:hypothetical protein
MRGERSLSADDQTHRFTGSYTYDLPWGPGPALFNSDSIWAKTGLINFDLALSKNFRINERVRLEFLAEAFNLTNTPAFNFPGATVGTATFGVISSTLPGTDARQIQFALKLNFGCAMSERVGDKRGFSRNCVVDAGRPLGTVLQGEVANRPRGCG